MKTLYVALSFCFALYSCNSSPSPLQDQPVGDQLPRVKTGLEVIQHTGFRILEGKRIGLVTNPTGVNSRLQSTVDILHEAENVELVALFGPEHGVRGNFSAGDHVENQRDEKTGIPVFSLYGANRKPGADALDLVDALVYDIQDIGVRSYTYISTMGLVMEAAAGAGKEVIILDRPNPLGGERVEGPMVEEGFRSFISQYSIPYVYGLTCGELALFLNGEKMLENGVQCSLEVVKMEGWKREMTFKETGLPWVPTSPHIPNARTAFYYASTGIIGEIDPNMIGIGYTLPFQTLAGEELDAERVADAMNALNLEGVLFRPIYFKPYYKEKTGHELRGVQIHLTDPSVAPLTEIQFYFLQEARKLDPGFTFFRGKEHRYRMFDLGCGSDSLRRSMMRDFRFEPLRSYWNGAADAFKERSVSYYLYP